MRLEHLDLAYAERPPEGLSVEQVVDEVTTLITAGKLRAWGVLNWPAPLIEEAASVSARRGIPGPCAGQLPYNLVIREAVEAPAMREALDSAGASVVASYTLHGGALSGKYGDPGAEGRVTARIDDRDYSRPLAAARDLSTLASAIGAAPAALAIAFTLANPRVATALFGATTPEQIDENLGAVELSGRLDMSALERLRRIGTETVAD